jgi:hypothetical protein
VKRLGLDTSEYQYEVWKERESYRILVFQIYKSNKALVNNCQFTKYQFQQMPNQIMKLPVHNSSNTIAKIPNAKLPNIPIAKQCIKLPNYIPIPNCQRIYEYNAQMGLPNLYFMYPVPH